MLRRPVRFHGIAARRPTLLRTETPDTNFLKSLQEFQARYSVDELKKLYYQLYDGIKLVENALEHFKAVKQGDKGDAGDTPTNAQLLALIRPLIPEVKDGETPTREEVAALVREYVVQPLPGKDGVSPSADDVAKKLVASKKLLRYLDKQIKSQVQTKEAQVELNKEDIVEEIIAELDKRDAVMNTKKIEGRFAEIRNQIAKSAPYNPPPGSKRGGGDTVVAGTGVTITNTRNGNKRISASGSSGAWSTPPETPNGVTTVFTVGSSAPNDVVADGTALFEGQGYTYSASQITFTNPPTLFVRYR